MSIMVSKTQNGGKMGHKEEPKTSKIVTNMTQIIDTIYFEFQRNLRKLFILIGIMLFFFFISFGISEHKYSLGEPLPDDPKQYFSSYLGTIGFLIEIMAVSFGGAVIAADFEKLTGNLLYPKISRGRLFIGRFIASFLMVGSIIGLNYVIIAAVTYWKYSEIPSILWTSLGWALFYCILVISFVMFFSSFMKTTGFTIIISLLMLIIGFQIIEAIFQFSSESEPFIVLTYYSRIITACINMPDPRYIDFPINTGDPNEDGSEIIFRTWLTPSAKGALIGGSIYTLILLVSAFLIFRRRQVKQ